MLESDLVVKDRVLTNSLGEVAATRGETETAETLVNTARRDGALQLEGVRVELAEYRNDHESKSVTLPVRR